MRHKHEKPNLLQVMTNKSEFSSSNQKTFDKNPSYCETGQKVALVEIIRAPNKATTVKFGISQRKKP